MPFAALPLPAPLGDLDFTSPDMRSWLRALRAQRNALDPQAPRILLGAGSLMAQDFVAHVTASGQAVALVDNARIGTDVNGVPIIGDHDLSAVFDHFPGAVGIMCCNTPEAIAHFVRVWQGHGPLLSWFDVISSSPGGDPIGGKFGFLRDFDHEDQIVRLHAATKDAFCDHLSRETFDALMLYRLTWDARVIAGVKRPEKAIYFEADVMPLSENEVMVDGGAFDGDTVRDFAAKTSGRYGHVHAFEIDPRNVDAFISGTADLPRVSLHQMGLWDGQGEMGFETDPGNCSRLNDTAAQKVKLEALDNLDLGRVTLLKLDIEGAEVEALEGSRQTIATYKPKLALSIYHKPDDFLTILPMVRALRPDYQFKLRHYSSTLFDTVLYAI